MNKFIRQARLPRGAYDQNLSLSGSLNYFEEKANKPRYCSNHLLSKWEKNRAEQYYRKCKEGYRTGEDCVIGK